MFRILGEYAAGTFQSSSSPVPGASPIPGPIKSSVSQQKIADVSFDRISVQAVIGCPEISNELVVRQTTTLSERTASIPGPIDTALAPTCSSSGHHQEIIIIVQVHDSVRKAD